jgi:hypothetical protein
MLKTPRAAFRKSLGTISQAILLENGLFVIDHTAE